MEERRAGTPCVWRRCFLLSVYLTHYLRPPGRDSSVFTRAQPIHSSHTPPPFLRVLVLNEKKKSGVPDPNYLHAVSPLPRHEFMDHGDVVAPRGSRSETADAFQD